MDVEDALPAAISRVDAHGNFANWLETSDNLLRVILKWRSHLPREVYEAADELSQAMPTEDFRRAVESQ